VDPGLRRDDGFNAIGFSSVISVEFLMIFLILFDVLSAVGSYITIPVSLRIIV